MALNNAERQARHRERVKEKLRNAAPSEPLRNDMPDAALEWLAGVDRDDEERRDFLRRLGPLVGDAFVPKHWFEDCALELLLARGNPIPEGLARKRGALRNA